MLPKFIEECNRLLPDGLVESTRCTGLCTHSTHLSSMPPQELTENAWKRTMEIWNLNGMEILCPGS